MLRLFPLILLSIFIVAACGGTSDSDNPATELQQSTNVASQDKVDASNQEAGASPEGEALSVSPYTPEVLIPPTIPPNEPSGQWIRTYQLYSLDKPGAEYSFWPSDKPQRI